MNRNTPSPGEEILNKILTCISWILLLKGKILLAAAKFFPLTEVSTFEGLSVQQSNQKFTKAVFFCKMV